MSVVEGRTTRRSAAVALAAIAFAAFLLLGLAVHRFGESGALLAFDRALVNHGAHAAWDVTQLARFSVLASLFIVLAFTAALLPAWRSRIVFSLVMLVLSWRAADFFQHVFARPRRADWVIFHETSFSYPSSHAAIAVAFYALWAWLLVRSGTGVPARVVATLLGLLVLALCWSRLALGAHYVTDIVGGALLGLALLAGGAAVWPEIMARRRRSGP